jgi:hypothetical protein
MELSTDAQAAVQAVADDLKGRIRKNDDGSITFTLEAPVKLEDAPPILAVTLKKIGAAEFRRINATKIMDGDGEATYAAIGILGGLLPSVQEKISGADLYWLGMLAKGFFMPARLGGR